MSNWLDQLWYPATPATASLPIRCLGALLRPLSALFTTIALARRRRQSREAIACEVPTLIIGNISVGGTGKTPLTIALVRHLQAGGMRVGIISRGYGGQGSDGAVPVSVAEHPDPAISGDEPLMMHQATGAPVYVHADRPAARTALLAAHDCDVVVSDDGLQHYRLSRDVEIAVINAARGLGNGMTLPAGPLRERPGRLLEVDFVVLNMNAAPARSAAPGHGTVDDSLRMNDTLAGLSGLGMSDTALTDLASRCTPMSLVGAELTSLVVTTVEPPQPPAAIDAVAGIGHPERFYESLRQLGFEVYEHSFPDHHRFTAPDLAALRRPVVMTEKDAVKCRHILPGQQSGQFWFLPVTATLTDAFHAELKARLTGS